MVDHMTWISAAIFPRLSVSHSSPGGNSLLSMRSRLACIPHSLWRPRPAAPRPRLVDTTQRLARRIHLEPFLMPPIYFTGLLGALWLWKCMMLVVFQNKIIYMPGMPPNSRRETIADYASECRGIQWHENRTRAADGTSLALAVANAHSKGEEASKGSGAGKESIAGHVYILYFQGNASSIPPRLPYLSSVLRTLKDSKRAGLPPVQFTLVCLSYRGYWTSRGRPSEKGIRRDAEAGLRWITQCHAETYAGSDRLAKPIVLLWGQSIGSGVATNLAASSPPQPVLRVDGVILETPFLSVRAMLEVLYPQKWLPYKRLWPFLRNQLDSWQNLGAIAEMSKASGSKPPQMFILEAGRDELVPQEHGEKLEQRCIEVGLPVYKKTVHNAFHNEAITRAEGRKAVTEFVLQQTQRHMDDTMSTD